MADGGIPPSALLPGNHFPGGSPGGKESNVTANSALTKNQRPGRAADYKWVSDVDAHSVDWEIFRNAVRDASSMPISLSAMTERRFARRLHERQANENPCNVYRSLQARYPTKRHRCGSVTANAL